MLVLVGLSYVERAMRLLAGLKRGIFRSIDSSIGAEKATGLLAGLKLTLRVRRITVTQTVEKAIGLLAGLKLLLAALLSAFSFLSKKRLACLQV